ncbi:putative ntf2 and rrm domain-containing protein [Cladorrhinum sp. PSN332]|nr:putative ntf2 and rrm domain-containing protein [Cladorrhinum sp. PSN332]
MATNGSVNHHEQYATAPQAPEQPPASEQPTTAENTKPDFNKDEVSWYFVEQYYTNLAKNPEKLHLYYGKKSQFVFGVETEIATIAVGRIPIQERIKQLDFQDAKVRVSNVDSQESGDNIVIQVIGEIANKGGESKKFVQTFVLAQQPSGYFVLNDILRYILDDVAEEKETAAEPTAPAEAEAAPVEVEVEQKEEVAPAEETTEKEEEPTELDAAAVAQKLEETVEEPPIAAEVPAPEPVAEVPEEKPAEEEKVETQPDAESVVEEIAEEAATKPEEPEAPVPTPAPAPVAAAPAPVAAPAPAQPEKPKEPPKPMTWASRLAAASGPKPVIPVIPKTATPPAPAQARVPAPAAAQQPASTETSPAAAATKEQGSEWQTAETKRQSRIQPVAPAVTEDKGTMAYIKYVTDKVKEDELKTLLASFGELAYFDINRQKNCAFVEFKTQAGYAAAVGANPHTVNGESIVVEQRRPKANAYGGSNYNATRGGGSGGRGSRGGYEPTRSGSQGRGGFTGQGRGRGGAPRGRGAAQAGAA